MKFLYTLPFQIIGAYFVNGVGISKSLCFVLCLLLLKFDIISSKVSLNNCKVKIVKFNPNL